METQASLISCAKKKSDALKFVLTIGVLSFFADFTYEGARSVYGPFLALLSASAAIPIFFIVRSRYRRFENASTPSGHVLEP
jgi:hypothetical protein